MLTADKIFPLIEELPEKEIEKLKKWFLERNRDKWDKQIEHDSSSGRLDFLIDEAMDEKSKGKLKEL